MKSVLISIRPEWVHKILDGKKTIEIRKNRPKIETPFKCYIYMTSGGWEWRDPFSTAIVPHAEGSEMYNGAQRVVAEFTCDRIDPIRVFDNGTIQNWNFYDLAKSCVPYDDVVAYIGNNRSGYGWHISDLMVYDKPKKLEDFTPHCKYMIDDMLSCDHRKIACPHQHFDHNPWPDCSLNVVICKRRMNRPPQSWCYVLDLEYRGM